MNVKDAAAILKPCEGHHILILTDREPHGYVHGQPCIRVHSLPPDQRQPDQGNVILWDGRFTRDGHQSGGTFWARDIRTLTWRLNVIAHIRTRQGATVSIIKLWKLPHKQQGDQSK